MTRTWTVAVMGVVGCHHQPPNFTVGKRFQDCPTQTLTAQEVSDLSDRGLKTVVAHRRGDHHSIGDLDAGLPMLKLAALHGNVPAMNEYANLIIWYGFIDNDNERFMGKTPWKNASEGLLFTLLAAHQAGEAWPHHRDAFTVLLDPTIPFPKDFFDDSGTAWLVQGWNPEWVDQIRIQAYRWKDCWSG